MHGFFELKLQILEEETKQFMKRKAAVICLISMLAALPLAACGGGKLAGATGFSYEDGILSFDDVEGAESYEVVFSHGGEVVYSDTVTETSLDMESLGLAGNLTLTVRAKKGKKFGPESAYEFAVLSTFGDVEFEAEDYLYNFGLSSNSNFRNNPLAHKGAYVGGIDDAGQGVYINYLCPVAGEYDFVAYYTTDMEPAKNEVWVNGTKQATFAFTEKTGWGEVGKYDAAEATVKITLKKGWNTISVMKNGDDTDEWGSYAELDYFVLKGTGAKYNVDDLEEYGAHPAAYRLEAEMGTPRKTGENNLIGCKNPAIQQGDGTVYSNGFLLGGVEKNYEGVEWHFWSDVRATYRITLAYASGEFTGSKLACPSFCVTQSSIEPIKSIDFEDCIAGSLKDLPYTGWNAVRVADGYVDVTLEAGDNYIYCLLLDSANSGYFQIDYIDLAFIKAL